MPMWMQDLNWQHLEEIPIQYRLHIKKESKKLEIYPEDKQLNSFQIVQNDGGQNGSKKHKTGVILHKQTKEETKALLTHKEEDFVNTDERDAQEAHSKVSTRRVEDMFARAMAWQFLKKYGVSRPKVIILRKNTPTATIDIQEFLKKRKSLTKYHSLPQSQR